MHKPVEALTALGDLLLDARRKRKQIELLSEHASISVDDAYDVQQYVMSAVCDERQEPIVAYKIGLTSHRSMSLYGAREPASGMLTSSDVKSGSVPVPLAEMYQPRVEPELVFSFTDDLSSGADADEILRKSTVTAGLEIPDSRFRDWFGRVKLTDLICDNTHAASAVIGAESAPAVKLRFSSIHARLFHEAILVAESGSEAVLDQLTCVAWLVRHLGVREQIITKGTKVFSGSLISPIRAAPGLYTAQLDGVGTVSLTFS